MQVEFAVAVLAFVVCKFFFGLLGWYSRNGSDDLYRQRLDTIWDRLHTDTLFDLAHRSLRRLVIRTRETLKTRRRALLRLAAMFFIINAISIVVALDVAILYLQRKIDHPGSGILNAFNAETPLSGVICLTIAALGVGFDLVSALISWFFLKKAAATNRLSSTIFHISADAVVAIVAMIWSSFTLISTVALMSGATLLETLDFLLITAGHLSSFMDDGWFAISIVMAASAAIPTLVHLSVSLVVLAAYATPRSLQLILRRSIFLVTTDEKPILGQLGTVAGAIAASLAALAGAIAKWETGT